MQLAQIPWHTAGKRLNAPVSAVEAIRSAQLDWKISKEAEAESDVPLIPRRFFVVREDLAKDSKDRVIGTVRTTFDLMQNSEACRFFDEVVESGAASYDSAGELGRGQMVRIMLRFHGDLVLEPGERIARFLLFIHSPVNGYHHLAYLPFRLSSGVTIAGGRFHNPAPQITIPSVRPRRFHVSTDAAV